MPFMPCIKLFNTIKTKEDLLKEFYLKVFLILLNNPLAFCCLINFNFLLSHTAHFGKSIILQFFFLATIGFLLSVFCLHFKQ